MHGGQLVAGLLKDGNTPLNTIRCAGVGETAWSGKQRYWGDRKDVVRSPETAASVDCAAKRRLPDLM